MYIIYSVRVQELLLLKCKSKIYLFSKGAGAAFVFACHTIGHYTEHTCTYCVWLRNETAAVVHPTEVQLTHFILVERICMGK